MKSMQSLRMAHLSDQGIRLLQNHPVMDEQFLAVYRQILSLSNIGSQLSFRNVIIHETEYMHQVYTVSNQNKPHIVCLHGIGASALAYLKMFQPLNEHFQVHALDLFGMGLSSRANWNDQMNSEQTINYYIDAIECWRKQIKLKRFILMGHSFGGLLAVYFYQKYWKEQQIERLVLLSPAGISQWTPQQIQDKASQGRNYFTCLGRFVFNLHIRPIKVVDLCCLGSFALNNLVTDKLKLPQNEQLIWKNYIRLIAKQKTVSEHGFYVLVKWPANADRNIEMVLKQVKPTTPFCFLFGTEDWMKNASMDKISSLYSNVSLNIIEKAGHNMIFDNPLQVAATIVRVCSNS